MREIKFRGRRIDDKSWVYGSLITIGGKAWIVPCDIKPEQIMQTGLYRINVPAFEVDPATVGQFTGLHDKNGKEIYEGDVVRLGYNAIHDGVITKCVWAEWRPGFIYEFITGENEGRYTDMMDTWRTYEIIGNIHENPELLGEEPKS
ncbi:MAG: YopX family protein [bacterium]